MLSIQDLHHQTYLCHLHYLHQSLAGPCNTGPALPLTAPSGLNASLPADAALLKASPAPPKSFLDYRSWEAFFLIKFFSNDH